MVGGAKSPPLPRRQTKAATGSTRSTDEREQGAPRAGKEARREERFAQADTFEDAYFAVVGNCSMCHAREPSWEGLHWPPKGVVLETQADVARHAEQIYLHAGRSRAMPPPNAIDMDPNARAQIVAWFDDVTGG